jgi:DNA-binding CsgD family transcriptional regulator
MDRNLQQIGGVYLTDLEVQLLRSLAKGLTTEQIASALSLAPKTVEHHLSVTDVRGIYWKIGVADRRQARAWALDHAEELGLLAPHADGQQADLPPEVLARSPFVVKLLAKHAESVGQFAQRGLPHLAEQQAKWLSKMLKRIAGEAHFRR